jgi:hypothetical protein
MLRALLLAAVTLLALGCADGTTGEASRRAAEAREERGNPPPTELHPSPTATYAYRLTAGPPDQKPAAVEVLEVVRVADGQVVFRDDRTFRQRDRNFAGWSPLVPDVLVAYSGDVGTSAYGARPDGTWGEVDQRRCFSAERLAEVGMGPSDSSYDRLRC